MRSGYRTVALTVCAVVVIVIWEIAARAGLLPALFLPAPTRILGSFRPQLAIGIASTTARAIAGYVGGLLFAYLIHFIFVALDATENLDKQFAAARAVPVIAVLPLFVIWFGFREVGRLLIVVLTTTGFYIAPLHEAFRVIPRQWAMLRRQLNLSAASYYAAVVIPGTLAVLAGALRVTLALAFTMAIASEYIGAQVGIGKFLESARITFNIPAIILAIMACSVIGVGMDAGLVGIFRLCVPWAGKQPKL
jgi:ABC-type nitrate/sulfonate/bicarbonate transport system permease component